MSFMLNSRLYGFTAELFFHKLEQLQLDSSRVSWLLWEGLWPLFPEFTDVWPEEPWIQPLFSNPSVWVWKASLRNKYPCEDHWKRAWPVVILTVRVQGGKGGAGTEFCSALCSNLWIGLCLFYVILSPIAQMKFHSHFCSMLHIVLTLGNVHASQTPTFRGIDMLIFVSIKPNLICPPLFILSSIR